MEKTDARAAARSAAIIFLCFLLTSTGWLAWEYRILKQTLPIPSELFTMVAGYLLQAGGIGVFSMLTHRSENEAGRIFMAALGLHMLFLVPAVLSPHLAGALAFGFLMNLMCGLIAGYYLRELAGTVPADHTAKVFSAGYGLAILSSWILTLAGGRSVYDSGRVVMVCMLLTAAAAAVGWRGGGSRSGATEPPAEQISAGGALTQRSAAAGAGAERRGPAQKNLLWTLCILVLLFSIVNSSGFAFPAADLGKAVNLELSRLVYAAGLLIAGFVTDRDRKYGAICALVALVIPFIILALQGETLPAVVFWVLSYFTFGFYSVYRVILFSDYASQRGMLCFAGFGLMLGRVGDALGEWICLALAEHLPVQIAVTAILFAGAVAVFFKVYNVLYVPEAERPLSEREKFHYFAAEHDLSAREQDMLRLIMENKTNAEIAGALYISENTVKFHIRNLLQKTGCKNRKELAAAFMNYAATGRAR